MPQPPLLQEVGGNVDSSSEDVVDRELDGSIDQEKDDIIELGPVASTSKRRLYGARYKYNPAALSSLNVRKTRFRTVTTYAVYQRRWRDFKPEDELDDPEEANTPLEFIFKEKFFVTLEHSVLFMKKECDRKLTKHIVEERGGSYREDEHPSRGRDSSFNGQTKEEKSGRSSMKLGNLIGYQFLYTLNSLFVKQKYVFQIQVSVFSCRALSVLLCYIGSGDEYLV
ncbi:hypothetical protein BX616_005428 [Lobosporangium transversale]|nr:hypothetical protein BX616_005428 [Lobosporangium transversale]